jgi:N-hydroxyarylamine O-acetyltransferase
VTDDAARGTGDQWAVGQLDLSAYLRRIGFTGSSAPTAQTLEGLHRAHLAAIPFENLDILLGRGLRVDLESVQGKLVAGRRGGYCFEHGQLLAAALERIGFRVDRLLARVDRGPGAPVGPRTHLTLRVRTPDRDGVWLADVGFGSSPPAPLSMRRLRSGAPQVVDGWVYEVAPEDDPGTAGAGLAGAGLTWALRELQGEEWATLYRFEDLPVYPADVAMGNHYTSTHPDSWFTRAPVLVRRSPEAITSLLGRTLTVTRPGHVKERRDLTDDEWARALSGLFGLNLTPGETKTLTAALPSA